MCMAVFNAKHWIDGRTQEEMECKYQYKKEYTHNKNPIENKLYRSYYEVVCK